MSSSSDQLKKQLQELTECKWIAEEEEVLQAAIEEQERQEEELQIAGEKRIVEERVKKEAEEWRLEILRRAAEREAVEAQRSAKLAQMSKKIDVSMTEDSEWDCMSPYLTSVVMLPILEAESRVEGLGRSWSRSIAMARSQGPKMKGLALVKLLCWYCQEHSLLVLQGLVCRTGMGLRTGPDCNRFKWTNGPGPPNFFEIDQKRLWS